MQEAQDVDAVQLDGRTADGAAGTGAEFESPIFYFTSRGCSLEEINAEKNKMISQSTVANWKLTRDSTSDPEKLNAEYIWMAGTSKPRVEMVQRQVKHGRIPCNCYGDATSCL